MNERIKELYTQALEYADSKVPSERRYNDIYYAIVSGKHAELIVQECAKIAEDIQEFYDENNDSVVNTEISTMIKLHFGVEE